MGKRKDEPKDWADAWVNPACSLGASIKCGCTAPDSPTVLVGGRRFCTMHAADFRADPTPSRDGARRNESGGET